MQQHCMQRAWERCRTTVASWLNPVSSGVLCMVAGLDRGSDGRHSARSYASRTSVRHWDAAVCEAVLPVAMLWGFRVHRASECCGCVPSWTLSSVSCL